MRSPVLSVLHCCLSDVARKHTAEVVKTSTAWVPRTAVPGLLEDLLLGSLDEDVEDVWCTGKCFWRAGASCAATWS